MIGRSEIIQALTRQLQICTEGAMQVCAITGPAGIGKSTLVQQLHPYATQFQWLEYHFFESLTLPYAFFHYILRSIPNDFPATTQLLTETVQDRSFLPEAESALDDVTKNRLIDTVRALLHAATEEKPIILVLEDVQWTDASTLDVFPLMLEYIQHLPMLIVLTYRNDVFFREHPLIKLRGQLRRQSFFSEYPLSLLTLEETHELIIDHLKESVDTQLSKRIFQQTEGLPFFVKELTTSLHRKGYFRKGKETITLRDDQPLPIPDTIRDMVALQLDEISEAAREVLEIASLLGQEFDLSLLSEVISNDPAIDELIINGVLIAKETTLAAFPHALVREVVKNDIVWSRRKQYHYQIAKVLETRQFSDEQVGQHWLRAGEKRKARHTLIRASQQYCRVHAHIDAARTAHTALSIWPKGEDEEERLNVVEQFAQCARTSGQLHDSIMAYREILDSPLMNELPQKRASVNRSLATSYALHGAWQHYKKCRKAAAEAHAEAGLFGGASQDWHDLANRQIDELNLTAALECISQALVCAEASGQTDLQARSLSLKGYILSIQGKHKEGEVLARQAVSLALANHHVEASAYAYRKLAGSLEYASDYQESLQVYNTALSFCQRENIKQQAQFCMSCMSWVLFRMGDWKRSLEVCQTYISDKNVNEASKALGLLIIGLIRGLRGEIKTAQKYIQHAKSITVQMDYHLIDSVFCWAMAMLHELEDQSEKAFHFYTQLLILWKQSEDIHDILTGLFSAASFFGERGYLEECHQTLEALTSIANMTGNSEAQGMMSYTLGEIAILQEKPEEAIAHYATAIQSFETLSIPLQLITAQYKTAKALLSLNRKEEAFTYLQLAAQQAKALGCRPMASTIASLQQQISLNKAERSARANVDSSLPTLQLTPRQLEITQALVDGLSNKEIAAKLNLSTRTVDMHVSHILDRLNCRTRTDAVRAALETGLI